MTEARVRGRTLMIGILAFAVLFGVVLWYFQTRAFYHVIHADSVTVAGKTVPVTDFRGIDAGTSPLKLRACFRMPALPDAPRTDEATPLGTPGWFDCYDQQAIADALATGHAVAYLAAANEPDGFDRIVVRMEDGRAFMWRQSNGKYD